MALARCLAIGGMLSMCGAFSARAAETQAPKPPAPLSPVEYRSLENEIVRTWQIGSRLSPVPDERRSELRSKVRRLFDASPSFTSLALYAFLIEQPGPTESPDHAAGAAEFAEMAAALTRDFSKEGPYPPAFQGLDLVNGNVRGLRAPPGSVFTEPVDVIGWAWTRERLATPLRTKEAGDVRLAVDFDGNSVATLQPVYELAKHLRKNAAVVLAFSGTQSDFTQPLAGIDTAVITTEFPAYAITPGGIVRGQFRSAGYFGGACSDRQPTAAEIAFPQPVAGPILGVFATGIAVDTERAKVQVRKVTAPDFGNQSLTTRVTFTVDLNGDGVPELRGRSRSDIELDPDFLSRSASPPARFLPVAGWYAEDYDVLDANVGGRWLRLSMYSVNTCT